MRAYAWCPPACTGLQRPWPENPCRCALGGVEFLQTLRPAAIVRAQADEAVRSGINATPTVRLDDGLTGKSLLLHGPIEGDALLSALDLVASEETVGPKASESPKSGATLTERRAR